MLSTESAPAVYEHYLNLLSSDPDIEHAYTSCLNGLILADSPRPIKTILVTSTQPAEGKTTVTVILALTALTAGKRILLVDGDLRRPRIHHLFGMDNKIGLSDLLAGSVGAQDAIRTIEVPQDPPGLSRTLSIMTSGVTGSTNTVLAMGSPKLRGILEELTPQFDLIFIDSPPALSVTDPLFLTPIVDATILIVAAGVVTERDAKRAKERLEQAGGRILGVVMNCFNEKLHGPSYHPYYRYYYTKKRS
jgi:capsular exopolysaccharide synthesis family protein